MSKFNIEDKLPENFANVVATGIMSSKKYKRDYYPNTFMDVRMIVEHAGALDSLKKFVDAFRRTARYRSYMSIYSIKEYEILENVLGVEETDEYIAAMAKDKINSEFEQDGEMVRNII